MKILKSDLQSAAEKQIITTDQADKLWNYFDGLNPDSGRFSALHVLYYFGGIMVLTSMWWFLTLAWENGYLTMGVSAAFAAIYLKIGDYLWKKPNLKIPAGLIITAAVGLAPVFIYGLEKALGLWPENLQNNYQDFHILIRSNFLFLEIGTIVAAMIALKFYKFPFITFPMAFSLWYMSMDLAPLLFGRELIMQERELVSCVFGLIVLAISYFVDRKSKEIDFAFWTYLYGMLAFWIGLSMMNSDDELGKFIYFLINLFLIVLSVYLHRKLFMVFGVIGVLGYTGHLAWTVFKDSLAFPLVLAALGILIIFIGIQYQKNKKKIEDIVEGLFPTFLNKWRPEERH